MTTLVPIDGSRSSEEAVRYAVRTQPGGDVLLLYIAPSGREVDLERGRFFLEDGRKTCRELAPGADIHTRLEVGDRCAKLAEVADEAHADLVVLGAHGVSGLPFVERYSTDAADLAGGIHRPVVMVLPSGRRLSD